jgi:hypothetical protein
MDAVLVGADRLGNIPDVLAEFGLKIGHHITGREPKHQRSAPRLPGGTELVILFTDFLGHNVMKAFREAAREQGVPCAARSARKFSGVRSRPDCRRRCAGRH